jgi:pimeloyl-ACP methyl ester carboxylesterase
VIHRRHVPSLAATAACLTLCVGATAETDGATRIAAEAAAAVNRAARAAADWVDSTFDSARHEVQRTHGAFAYTPGVGNAMRNDWSTLDAVERVDSAIVLVHGLDEPGDVWRDLAPALYDAGHTVIRFDYPNDQAIAESGRSMFEAMRAVRALGIERIHIVGHSMGGLVTREMLTADALYAGAPEAPDAPRVESLIAVGTPFHGSALARFQAVGEVRDHLVRCIDHSGGDPRALLGFLYDGRGEAGDDLMPGSDYLTACTDRPMHPEIAVTSIIGRALPLDGHRVSSALDGTWVAGLVGDSGVDAVAKLADRTADRLGDGAVSESSACGFPGSEEVLVRANHRSLLRRAAPFDAMADALGMINDEPPAIAEILARVGEPR